jgi:hypothetical protein
VDAAEKWLTEHDPSWKPQKASRDLPAGGTCDEYDPDADTNDGSQPTPSFMWLVDHAEPWLPSTLIDQHYRQTHREVRRLYSKEWHKRAKANPNRFPGRTYFAGMYRTSEQIEERRAEGRRRYHENKDAINARKRAARKAAK